jgi:hypothetical protein
MLAAQRHVPTSDAGISEVIDYYHYSLEFLVVTPILLYRTRLNLHEQRHACH